MTTERRRPAPLTRFIAYLMAGLVAGFGTVFMDLGGLLLGLIGLGVIVFTCRRLPADLVRPGAYLLGAGAVGLSIIGPALGHPEAGYFFSSWTAAWVYAGTALAGALLVAVPTLLEARTRRGV